MNLLLASVGSSEEAASPRDWRRGTWLEIRAGLLEETAEEGIEGEPVSPDRVGETQPRRRDKQRSSAHWVGLKLGL